MDTSEPDARNRIKQWSEEPLIRQLQEAYAEHPGSLLKLLEGTGIDRGTFYATLVYANRNPRIDTYLAIANALGFDLSLRPRRRLGRRRGRNERAEES